MRHALLFVFLSSLCLVGGCGGASDDAPFAHPLLVQENRFGGGPPELAEIIAPSDLVARVESGTYTLVTARERQEAEAEAQADAADDRQTAMNVYGGDPELLERMDRDIDPNDPDAVELGDGSVLVRGIPADPQRGIEDQWFQLDGPRWSDRELVLAKDVYETQATQLEIYEHLYELVDENYRQQHALPLPDQLQGEDFDGIHDLNEAIGLDWELFLPPAGPQPPPPGYPASWRDEEGAGTPLNPARGLDRQGRDVLPTGLWSMVDFPLKWCATTVRSQGGRGTCVFFAITGAMEASYAARRSRWVNLSEQFFYNQARKVWIPTNYGDGSWPMITLANMKNNAFVFPFERRWEYNTSLWRRGDDAAMTYSRSCWADGTGAPYLGRFCSETNHQSPMACVTLTLPGGLGSTTFCATRNPVEVERDSGIGLVSAPVVSHFHRRVANHGLAKAFLAFKVPIVYCYDVPERTFFEPGGVLPYDPTDTRILGAHCSVILGYVRNADLPAGVPPGSGGGYYVIKNSWGTDFGDGGYFYAPDDWVAKYLISMYAVTRVSG